MWSKKDIKFLGFSPVESPLDYDSSSFESFTCSLKNDDRLSIEIMNRDNSLVKMTSSDSFLLIQIVADIGAIVVEAWEDEITEVVILSIRFNSISSIPVPISYVERDREIALGLLVPWGDGIHVTYIKKKYFLSVWREFILKIKNLGE